MRLQTTIPVIPSPLRLSQQRKILLVGSCFTEHIGQRLRDFGFNVLVNPFGIMYKPVSIADCLRRCLQGEEVTASQLIRHEGLWHSWLHHGSFYSSDKEECLCRCNDTLREAHQFLQEPCDIIVTLGTAFVYEHQGHVIANCHKLPASQFTKRMLSVEEIVAALNPYKALYTLSPIRHWADGAHGNQLSKASLLLAIERLQHPYFPAYEIMMDELRDYRFYDQDMLHPSPLAIEIIWERFQQTYMDADTIALGQRYHQLHLLEAHQPLHPGSANAINHQEKIEALRHSLNNRNLN